MSASEKTKGYELIEPPESSVFLRQFHPDLPRYVALLHWLLETLHRELAPMLTGIELTVIQANYFGPYPTLAAHYESDNPASISPVVHAVVTRIFSEQGIEGFNAFLACSKTDWKAVTEKIMRPIKNS